MLSLDLCFLNGVCRINTDVSDYTFLRSMYVIADLACDLSDYACLDSSELRRFATLLLRLLLAVLMDLLGLLLGALRFYFLLLLNDDVRYTYTLLMLIYLTLRLVLRELRIILLLLLRDFRLTINLDCI